MIPRYSRPEMTEIWSDEYKFARWLDVEIAVCEVHAEDVAQAFVALAKARKTTGHVEAVDGGNIAAALR